MSRGVNRLTAVYTRENKRVRLIIIAGPLVRQFKCVFARLLFVPQKIPDLRSHSRGNYAKRVGETMRIVHITHLFITELHLFMRRHYSTLRETLAKRAKSQIALNSRGMKDRKPRDGCDRDRPFLFS